MGERRGHPVVGVLIVLATLAGGFVGAGLVLYLFAFGEGGGACLFLVMTLLFLVGGMSLASWVGSGGPGDGTVGGFTWQVSEPGAHLRLSPGGEESVWLAPGATVKEVGQRHRGLIKVIALGGERGWLDRREVRPPADEPSPPA